MRRILLIVMAAVLGGCSGMLIDESAGRLLPDGRVSPCGTFHADPQACGNAKWNSKVIGRITIGQSRDEVLAIMGHKAERFELPSAAVERWFFLTDYEREIGTAIEFTNGRVSSVRIVPWLGT